MNWQPLLPMWLVAITAVALIGAWWYAYRGTGVVAWLRLGGLLVLLAFLANPVRIHQADQGERPRLALVLDASASMAAPDGNPLDAAATTTRYQAALSALDELSAATEGGFSNEIFAIGSELRPGAAEAATDSATSFASLDSLLSAEHPPSAVVLLSDGIDRASTSPDQAFATAGVPVSVIAVGGALVPDNLSVSLSAPSPSAFPQQDMSLSARLLASPACVGRRVTVIWESIADDGSASEIHRSEQLLEAEQDIDHTINVGDSIGETLWQVRVTAFPDEVSADDNQAAVAVQVVDKPLRILVLEGQPYWDTTFALRAWRRDQQLTVRSAFRLGGRSYRSGDGTDTDETPLAQLSETDVVVLGRRVEELLNDEAQRTLANWVRDGGGLLLIGPGRREDGPLAELDPIRWASGRREKVALRMAPGGRRLALLPADDSEHPTVTSGRVHALRARSEILIDGDEPVVVTRHHGAGEVVAVNAEGLWRWRLEARSTAADRFWRQLLKGLVEGGGGPLRGDRPRYRSDSVATVAIDPEVVRPLQLRAPDGTTTSLPAPGDELRIPLPRPGIWRLSSADNAAATSLIVAADLRERLELNRNDARLLRLTQSTGGHLVEAAGAAELGASLARRAELRAAAATVEPLITAPWWVPLVVLLLGAEWWLRRTRHGVV
jgi:hypothetical protein